MVVTKRDIGPGESIRRQDLRVIPLPAEATPQGSSADVTHFAAEEASRFLPSGTVLVDTDLRGSQGTLPVPAGYSQTVLNLAQPAEFLNPGDTVEIWGPGLDCETDVCPARRLAEKVQVIDVIETGGTMLNSAQSLQLTVNLPAESVGLVLHAAHESDIHFVRRE